MPACTGQSRIQKPETRIQNSSREPRPVRSPASVIQTYKIVVFATLFLSAASVLGPPSSWQPPSNAVRVDARNEFDSGLNLCPSAFICGSIGFGCGLRGRAMFSSANLWLGAVRTLVPWSLCGKMSACFGVSCARTAASARQSNAACPSAGSISPCSTNAPWERRCRTCPPAPSS